MSSEQLVESIGQSNRFESYSRRVFSKRAVTGLGCLALGAGAFELGAPHAIKQYEKYSSSFGGNYSKDFWDFLKEVGAESIDRDRLNELLTGSLEVDLEYLGRVGKEYQSDPNAIAEYDLVPRNDGPIYLDFEGLYGDNINLNVLRAVVDDSEQFLIPLLRDNTDQPPVSIQLGPLTKDAHKLQLFSADDDTEVSGDEIFFLASQGTSGTLRSFIEANQPDIYLHKYGNLTNNFPRRSYAAIHEIPGGDIAVVYTTECFDEDQVSIFDLGSDAEDLEGTKGRPTDKDWGVALVISHVDGRIISGIISEPYHNTQEIPIGRQGRSDRMSVRLASPNNNLKRVTDSSTLKKAKVRFRPIIGTHDEINGMLYSTDISSARESLCENYDEGKIDQDDSEHLAMLEKYDLDLKRCGD